MKYGDLVSIIVPVYNRAHLISRSVGCLVTQSYYNLDIILVDDCSSDDIEGAVAELGDSRIRLIRRKRNGGSSAARNTGIAAAKGNLIAFHDSDDLCVFDKIERQMRALEKLPEDYIGIYTAVLFYPKVNLDTYSEMKPRIRPLANSSPLSGDMYKATVGGNVMNLPTMLLKKKALVAAGELDERLRNNVDWDLTLRLTKQGKFHFLPEPSYLVASPISRADISQSIARSLKYSAKSFVFITGKLRRSGERSPALARHYYNASTIFLQLGRPGFSRRYLRAALSIGPFHLRYLVLYFVSHVPSLYPPLRWLKRRGKPDLKNPL